MPRSAEFMHLTLNNYSPRQSFDMEGKQKMKVKSHQITFLLLLIFIKQFQMSVKGTTNELAVTSS